MLLEGRNKGEDRMNIYLLVQIGSKLYLPSSAHVKAVIWDDYQRMNNHQCWQPVFVDKVVGPPDRSKLVDFVGVRDVYDRRMAGLGHVVPFSDIESIAHKLHLTPVTTEDVLTQERRKVLQPEIERAARSVSDDLAGEILEKLFGYVARETHYPGPFRTAGPMTPTVLLQVRIGLELIGYLHNLTEYEHAADTLKELREKFAAGCAYPNCVNYSETAEEYCTVGCGADHEDYLKLADWESGEAIERKSPPIEVVDPDEAEYDEYEFGLGVTEDGLEDEEDEPEDNPMSVWDGPLG